MGLAAKTTTAARGNIRARFKFDRRDGMPATLDGAYLDWISIRRSTQVYSVLPSGFEYYFCTLEADPVHFFYVALFTQSWSSQDYGSV